ncbi:MAG: hypothetical protein H7A51_00100 [Akkermansiaceae bacterium]|nr:hypothetical protein [Akkermansiaceae bacterium]
MNNPYSHPRLTRLKRISKLRYALALLSQFPKYVGWQLSRLVPDELGLLIRRRFGFLAVPFKQLADFLRYWISTRPWKKLLIGSPLLLVLIWIFSTLFLAKSQTDEELYGDYRKSLLNATGQGNYKVADFLAGKLLMNPAYERDEPLLFASMIAAHENGNIPRRDLLLARLTGELNSPRAHMWQASRLLSIRASGEANITQAVEHIKKAILLSDNPDPMKVQLVNIYFQQGRYQQAISILDELKSNDYGIGTLKASLYLADGDKDKAYSLATDVLHRMDEENPEKDKYFKDRLDALTVLSDLGGSLSGVKKELLGLSVQLEDKMRVSPDDEILKPLLVGCYMVVGKILLQDSDEIERRKALIYLEKAISVDEVPYRMGGLVLSASNLDSSGGLTEQQMRDALVNGDGVAIAHVFLGLDAWKKDLMDEADFHFRIAFALEPNSMRVVEFVAINVAQAPKEGALNPFRLSLENEALWRRALRLLKMASMIDASMFDRNLYTQSIILSNRQRWAEIPILVEPHLDKISGSYRARFLQLLVRAYSEIGDRVKVAQYTKLLKAAVSDDQE